MADTTELIRDRVKTIILSVDATQKVYNYPIAMESEDDFILAFGTGVLGDDNVQIAKGWTIQLSGITTTRQGARSGPEIDEFVVLAECHWSEYSNGQSEIAFSAHVNAVRRALTASFSLDSLPSILKAGPAQAPSIGYRRWGMRLAHSAVLLFPVRITVARSVT